MTWLADEHGRIYTDDTHLEVGRMVTPELAQTVADLVNLSILSAPRVSPPDRIAQIRAQAGYPRTPSLEGKRS